MKKVFSLLQATPLVLTLKTTVAWKIADALRGVADTIGSNIINAISTLIGKGLYYIIVKGLLSIVNLFYRFFAVFAGLERVEYDGTKSYLLNIFFNNSTVSTIYWGMALIGMAMVFGFAILAVIRKIFDIDDKHQKSLGSILRNCFKSIFVMLVLNLCVSGVLNSTNVLMQSVVYLFDNAETLNSATYIEFTADQYAAMARVINTIGNYSLNPSSQNRYNINSCFNEIREDLSYLQDQGVFAGHYETYDAEGNKQNNWLTLLQGIVGSADLSYDLNMDVYYESVSNAMIEAMDTLTTTPQIPALKDYTWKREIVNQSGSECVLDRALFLAGTTGAARSGKYNENASVSDAVRGPFYTGEKDIYSLSDVTGSFDIKLSGINYLLIAITAFFTLKYLFKGILQCTSRIFTMISLYLIAPPFIATMPWDDGEKFRQWTQAFIIQCFGVFGTVIPMRIVVSLIPIILGGNLVLFSSSVMNMVAKIVLIIGGLYAVDTFSGLLTGMLSGNVGYAAAHAQDRAGAVGEGAFRGTLGIARSVAGVGLSLGGVGAKGVTGVAGGVARGIGAVTGLTALGRKIGGAAGRVGENASERFNSFESGGGIPGAIARGIRNKMGSKDKGPSTDPDQKSENNNGGTVSPKGNGISGTKDNNFRE